MEKVHKKITKKDIKDTTGKDKHQTSAKKRKASKLPTESEDSSVDSSSSQEKEPKVKKKKLSKPNSSTSKGGFINSDRDTLQKGDEDLPISKARFEKMMELL